MRGQRKKIQNGQKREKRLKDKGGVIVRFCLRIQGYVELRLIFLCMLVFFSCLWLQVKN